LAFFGKDIFTFDLFLADAETGKIIKKLSSITLNHEIDDFSFNESAGTWSPDSKKFAFVIFKNGKNKLAIVDVEHAKIIDEIEFDNVPSFCNPEWSPDGRHIVFQDWWKVLPIYTPTTLRPEILRNLRIVFHPKFTRRGRPMEILLFL